MGFEQIETGGRKSSGVPRREMPVRDLTISVELIQPGAVEVMLWHGSQRLGRSPSLIENLPGCLCVVVDWQASCFDDNHEGLDWLTYELSEITGIPHFEFATFRKTLSTIISNIHGF